MTTCELSMKLLIDTKADKVLFAEADKNCVDFLFHILSLPISTVIRLLKKEGMTGSLSNLYDSLENMNDTYIQSKDILLNPKSSFVTSPDNPFLLLDEVTTHEKTFYGCSNSNIPAVTLRRVTHTRTNFKSCSMSFTDDPEATCPNCGNRMSRKLNYIASAGVKEAVAAKGGYVKEAVTYLVMDDLVVMPMSAISNITLLNKFNVKNVGVLQEKVVNFGMKKALKMLKASFESKTVLTNVFISDAKYMT